MSNLALETKQRIRVILVILAAGLAGDHAIARQASATRGMVTPNASCTSLEGRKIAASEIGLPTTGASVVSATLVEATGQHVSNGQVVLAIPEYCRVKGIIAPIDPQAPTINVQVNVPTSWNGKLIQLGGSGLNGGIPVSLTTSMQWGPESIPPNAPYALSRGFVTYGSDSGHTNAGMRVGGPGFAVDWMSNQEALTNFASAQMKKTHDVAVVLVKTLYGVAPRHSYFMGTSQGGREALMVAQRFPQDYDGVFSQIPVFPHVYWIMLQETLRAQTQVGDAWIPRDKVAVIGKEVLRQCDALDGIADGLVSNYVACNRRFDPAVSPHALAAVRCEAGGDTGAACLSDAQIKAANAIHATVEFGFSLAHGWTSIPGWTTGSELATNWKFVPAAPTPATPLGDVLGSLVAPPSVTLLDFKPADYRVRLQELSALLDASDPDLSAFRRRGGKLILKVNTTDYTANPRWSYAYYDKVAALMGQGVVDQFMRFYVAVGIFHNRNVGRNPITNEIVPSVRGLHRHAGRLGRDGKGAGRCAGSHQYGHGPALQRDVQPAHVPVPALSAVQGPGRSQERRQLYVREAVGI